MDAAHNTSACGGPGTCGAAAPASPQPNHRDDPTSPQTAEMPKRSSAKRKHGRAAVVFFAFGRLRGAAVVQPPPAPPCLLLLAGRGDGPHIGPGIKRWGPVRSRQHAGEYLAAKPPRPRQQEVGSPHSRLCILAWRFFVGCRLGWRAWCTLGKRSLPQAAGRAPAADGGR
jgi:hypothetical protein